MKDIKIQTNGKGNIDVITHSLNLGYYVDLSKERHLLAAEYLLLDPNQSLKWCNKEIYICALGYEEMTAAQFMEYRGED